MEKYIITKDVILLMARVAATLEVGAALETPEKYHTSQYGELLKDLAADIYDCILLNLEPYQENNEVFMHKYPESKPERLLGYKEYLILDRNEEYHIAYLDMNNNFVDPENDYLPYPKDFIKGWLSIV